MSSPELQQPDPDQEYLAYVAEVAHEASETVIQELGLRAIQGATDITLSDSEAGRLVENITEFIAEHDITTTWSQELDLPTTTGIVDGANELLAWYDLSFDVSNYNAPTLGDENERASTVQEMDDMLAMGEDDVILGLTINKDFAGRRVDSDGIVEYQTESGKWIAEDAVDYSRTRWSNDPSALQKAFWYLDRKMPKPDPDR